MIVVLDTSCISAFIRANKISILLDALKKHRIVITRQVYQELLVSKQEVLRNFRHPSVGIVEAKSSIADKYPIHIGEASVIMFAKENNALAIIDDKKAREATEREGIEFIGTATLIKIAINNGVIKPHEKEAFIQEITTSGNLYLSDEIRKWL